MKKQKLETISDKLKRFRKERDISLDWLANQTGYCVDFLKKLETGKATPAVGTILQIAKALDVNSGVLLNEEKTAKNQRIESYIKRTEFYAYKTLAPGAENKHLKAFLVTIEPMQEHIGAYYQHEGEEFIYVLKGAYRGGCRGSRKQSGPGGNPCISIQPWPTNWKNIGSGPAELLVVLFTP